MLSLLVVADFRLKKIVGLASEFMWVGDLLLMVIVL